MQRKEWVKNQAPYINICKANIIKIPESGAQNLC